MIRFIASLFLMVLIALPASAQEKMSFIRDTEIEVLLQQWCAPMFRAAGFNPESVKIILIDDDGLNAFTAGGQVIFVTTGLLMKAERPDEVIGVMAHETGHIAGGHVLMQKTQMKNASYQSLAAMILGTGVGLLTGNGQAGTAITSFGRAGAMHGFLSHSRLEESSADQAALTFLRQSNTPTKGLGSFMEKLQDQELLPPSQQQPYARTHPVTRDRIEALETRISASPPGRSAPQQDAELKRIQTKLQAFTHPSRAAYAFAKDNSADGVMARAIIAYRQNRVGEALKLADQWLAQEPDNPYAFELKGQILKDGSRPADAVPVYREALKRAPRSPLIRIDGAHALIESHNPKNLDEAISWLNMAIEDEPRNSLAFRLLATAYGQKGLEPEAQVYLAEMALLDRQPGRARELLAIAVPKLKASSPVRRRASDLKLLLDSMPDKT